MQIGLARTRPRICPTGSSISSPCSFSSRGNGRSPPAVATLRRCRHGTDERPDLPFGSTQALAASVRGAFGNAIAWMCLRRGIGPGHQDWPELSRAIVAFGGSVQGFRPGLPACGLQWWENPEIIPGMTGMPTATPAATAMASLLSRQAVTDTPPERHVVPPAAAEPAVSPAPCRPRFARVAAGPPTGPPRGRDFRFCDACTTGASAWPAPLS